MPNRPDNTLRWVLSILIIVVLVVILIGLFVYPPTTWQSPTPGYFPFWFFGFFIAMFFLFFIIRILFWGLFGMPRWRYMRHGGWYEGQRTAQQTLDERYARGEITRDQYLQMKDDLMRGKSP